MTGGLEGRCSVQLSYGGWAETIVTDEVAGQVERNQT